eukprot:tig00021357_g20763.t1
MHSHRSEFKQQNKTHKATHASNRVLNEKARGKVERVHRAPVKSASKAAALHKKNRVNHAKQVAQQKRSATLAKNRAEGRPPKCVALIALTDDADLDLAHTLLLNECGVETLVVPETPVTCRLPGEKQRVTIIKCRRDFAVMLDAAKVADTLFFVLRANSEPDFIGQTAVSILRAQGLPHVMGFLQGLDDVAPKHRNEVRRAHALYLEQQFSGECKLLLLDTPAHAKQAVRAVSTSKIKELAFRHERAHLLAERVEFEPQASSSQGTLRISGYVRGGRLSANQLVHISGVGTFQLGQIDGPADPVPTSHQVEGMEGASTVLDRPDAEKQEPLASEAAVDPMANEQTWPSEEEIAKASAGRRRVIKRLARGMSDYQACWIPDELSEGEEAEASDAGDGHDDARMSDAGSDAKRSDDAMEAEDGGGGDAASADDDNDEYKDKDDNRVELDPDVQLVPDHVQFDVETQARMRFGRYRGLKSMRSSPWDPKENLPLDFGRIFHFEHFSRTRQHALKLAQEHIVPAGTWVTLHVADFPAARVAELDLRRGPVVVGALLQHENRTSVLNFLVTKSPSCDAPVPNKEVLEVHCGWRRFDASCLFSQHTPNADKHKMEKELPASGHSVVTVFGPITYPPSPVLLFKRDASGVRTLVASGSLSSVDADRIILKKIVLCGHVFRIHKSRAVVRHMFFNPEDIKWFTPVQLWTKNGRIGHIREPLGTHGYMKCQFDAQLRQDDVVCMSLYKRVFPKWPKPAAS